jgi:hypothetical protein
VIHPDEETFRSDPWRGGSGEHTRPQLPLGAATISEAGFNSRVLLLVLAFFLLAREPEDGAVRFLGMGLILSTGSSKTLLEPQARVWDGFTRVQLNFPELRSFRTLSQRSPPA